MNRKVPELAPVMMATWSVVTFVPAAMAALRKATLLQNFLAVFVVGRSSAELGVEVRRTAFNATVANLPVFLALTQQ